MPRIAAAVCNFNRRDMIVECVRALLAQGGEDLSVHVLDNASTDGSVEALRALGDPRVRVEVNGENEGSSGGFHKAIEMALGAGAQYLAVLDSDCVVNPGALEALARFLDREGSFAMAGPKVYWARPAGIVQELGAFIDWPRAVFARNHGDLDEAKEGELTGVEEVDYAAACCLMVRVEAVERVGNVLPDWFIYFDDIEWCTRFRRAGLRIAATPEATAVHHGGGANKSTHFTTYYYWRNRILFFSEFAPEGHREAARTALYGDAVRGVATCEALGLHQAARVIETAVADALAGRLGKRQFAPRELAFDPPLPKPEAKRETIRVSHVLEDAPRYAGRDSWTVLVDDFGKSLTLGRALELQPAFEAVRERLREKFAPLLAYSFSRALR